MKNMKKVIVVALFVLGAFFLYKSYEYYVVAKEAKEYDFIDRNTLSPRVAIDMSKAGIHTFELYIPGKMLFAPGGVLFFEFREGFNWKEVRKKGESIIFTIKDKNGKELIEKNLILSRNEPKDINIKKRFIAARFPWEFTSNAPQPFQVTLNIQDPITELGSVEQYMFGELMTYNKWKAVNSVCTIYFCGFGLFALVCFIIVVKIVTRKS